MVTDKMLKPPYGKLLILEMELARAAEEANELVKTCCARGLDDLLDRAITSRTDIIKGLMEARGMVGPWGEATGYGAMSCVGCKIMSSETEYGTLHFPLSEGALDTLLGIEPERPSWWRRALRSMTRVIRR